MLSTDVDTTQRRVDRLLEEQYRRAVPAPRSASERPYPRGRVLQATTARSSAPTGTPVIEPSGVWCTLHRSACQSRSSIRRSTCDVRGSSTRPARPSADSGIVGLPREHEDVVGYAVCAVRWGELRCRSMTTSRVARSSRHRSWMSLPESPTPSRGSWSPSMALRCCVLPGGSLTAATRSM